MGLMRLRLTMATYYYILASEHFLLEEEPFEEVLKLSLIHI